MKSALTKTLANPIEFGKNDLLIRQITTHFVDRLLILVSRRRAVSCQLHSAKDRRPHTSPDPSPSNPNGTGQTNDVIVLVDHWSLWSAFDLSGLMHRRRCQDVPVRSDLPTINACTLCIMLLTDPTMPERLGVPDPWAESRSEQRAVRADDSQWFAGE